MGLYGVDGSQRVALADAAARTPSPRPKDPAPPAAPVQPRPPVSSEDGVRAQAAPTKGEAPTSPTRAGMRLRVDEDSKRIIAQIIDENNEVIRQIPPEEMLQIATRFRKLRGLLFDKQA